MKQIQDCTNRPENNHKVGGTHSETKQSLLLSLDASQQPTCKDCLHVRYDNRFSFGLNLFLSGVLANWRCPGAVCAFVHVIDAANQRAPSSHGRCTAGGKGSFVEELFLAPAVRRRKITLTTAAIILTNVI